jgi:hypothetical protein
MRYSRTKIQACTQILEEYVMHKINAGLVVILAASLILAACGQRTPVAPTVDANAIYTQAAATVQAGLAQTESSQPTATKAPATSTPTMIALNNATNTPQAGSTAGTPATPGAGTGTPSSLIPTLTKPPSLRPSGTGDKAYGRADPADGTTVHKQYRRYFTLKTPALRLTTVTFRYAGDRRTPPRIST